jgi:hypothetical protein
MRYLVTARLRDGQQTALNEAIENGTLGRGSVAGDEYLHDMAHARQLADGRVKWVETCFCPTPLQEERPYWEEYFELESVKDAHARSRCRDENGTEPWACCDCDCTKRLEGWLARQGRAFLESSSALLPQDAGRIDARATSCGEPTGERADRRENKSSGDERRHVSRGQTV